ncbi:MAG: hypothetical protein AAF711_08110 [Planctomycetota bacterium]
MKATAQLLVTASLLILLTGCAGYRHNKAGDAAVETGDMRSAVYHYERALAKKDKYARDAEFLTKLAAARSRVAYDDAKKARAEGRYETALDHLRESIRQDPGFADPEALLPAVLKEAGQWRYTQAVAAADRGSLEAARENLVRAMRHDMANESVAYAMASLEPGKLNPSTPGLSEYNRGITQSAERRWALAEETLQKSIAANAGLLPPRAALHGAREQLGASRRLQDDGRNLIDRLTMGPAIRSLEQSLEVWPYNTQASGLLTKAKAQRALADEQLALATKAAGEARWDDAIAQADSGLAIDRSHPALDELRSALPRRAAADFAKRGDGHLEKGDLDRAHQAYGRSLSYRDTNLEARVGMALVYATWAKEHEEAGRLGAALLNYAKGQAYTRNKSLDDGVVRMAAAVRDRLGMGLMISADGRGGVDPRQLSSATLSTLAGKRSHGLAIQGQGMPYELRMSIRKATIDERRTNTSRRIHKYTTQELRYNPEYDRVASRLRAAERDYDRACRAYNNATGKNHAKDHPDYDPHYDRLRKDVDRKRSRVNKLRHELSCTPRKIKVTLHHEWPYTVETFTKTGELSVVTELVDTASGKPVRSFTHQASFAQSDDRTLNSNPSVGVRHDDLRLASDGAVSAALTDQLASAAGPWAVNGIVDHRLALINASVDFYEQEGKTAEALEARVDGAVLIGLVDRKGSQASLDKLTELHTR